MKSEQSITSCHNFRFIKGQEIKHIKSASSKHTLTLQTREHHFPTIRNRSLIFRSSAGAQGNIDVLEWHIK